MILIHLALKKNRFPLNLLMSIFRKIRKPVLVLLMFALCLVFYNHANNWHYHMLNNGVVIEHSHPYDKQGDRGTSFPSHNHSKSSLLFFDMISNLFVLLIVAIGVQQVFRRLSFIIVPSFIPELIKVDCRRTKSPRAPPYSFF